MSEEVAAAPVDGEDPEKRKYTHYIGAILAKLQLKRPPFWIQQAIRIIKTSEMKKPLKM